LTLSHGGLAYFCYAASSAALAGVLLGTAALPLWAAQLVQGFVVCATVLHDTHPPAVAATFLLAAPVAGLLAGIGAVLVTRSLVRQMRLSVVRVATAQRSAAALERARLARELHDSVAKTLRGMSLAALALPWIPAPPARSGRTACRRHLLRRGRRGPRDARTARGSAPGLAG
jgi:signal transduction histidine kinase